MRDYCLIVVSAEENDKYFLYSETFYNGSFGKKKPFLYSSGEIFGEEELIKEVERIMEQNPDYDMKLKIRGEIILDNGLAHLLKNKKEHHNKILEKRLKEDLQPAK